MSGRDWFTIRGQRSVCILLIGGVLCCTGTTDDVYAGPFVDSVIVSSKIFASGSQDVIEVKIHNDSTLNGWTIPLVIRSQTGGAFGRVDSVISVAPFGGARVLKVNGVTPDSLVITGVSLGVAPGPRRTAFRLFVTNNSQFGTYSLDSNRLSASQALKLTHPPAQPIVPVFVRGLESIATGNFPDLHATVGGSRARPGFSKLYGISYGNIGSLTTIGTVTLALPRQVIHQSSSDGGVYNPGTHSVTWNVGPLAPGFIDWLVTVVGIPNSVPLGTTLISSVYIEALGGDPNPGNNTDWESQFVRGAFDPNEKLVSPQGEGPFGLISRTDTLRYQVNFQNVGTDTAFDIVVRDTLDNNLDEATVESGASSHPYVFSIAGRELSWTFTNINLPDSIVDELGSHGFVTYKVRPKANATSGTDIKNRAAVYFDFNPPVITNTVSNRICDRRGDVAGDPNTNCPDRTIDIVDIVAVINNVVFNTPFCGPADVADVAGDPNGCPDTNVDIVDIVSIINNVVFGTPFCLECL